MTTQQDKGAPVSEPSQPDRLIFRSELQTKLGKSTNTIRNWLKDGRLPAPDVHPTRMPTGCAGYPALLT